MDSQNSGLFPSNINSAMPPFDSNDQPMRLQRHKTMSVVSPVTKDPPAAHRWAEDSPVASSTKHAENHACQCVYPYIKSNAIAYLVAYRST